MQRNLISGNIYADEFCRVWKKESFLDGVRWTLLKNVSAKDFVRVDR